MEEEKILVSNVPNEVLMIGALCSNPELMINYSRVIVSQYDFSDEITKFLFDTLELMYNTYSQDFNENSVNTFMIQDEERKIKYRQYGGWKTIKKAMTISNVEDIENYYATLKKYSLLRELDALGCDGIVQKIMRTKNFQKLNAMKISQMIRGKLDKTSTIIMADKESDDLVDNATNRIKAYTTKPSVGIPTFWNTINNMTKGLLLQKLFCIGMLSNDGKSRMMMSLACHVAMIDKQRVLILSNEMDNESLFNCLMTTIINSKAVQEEYGWTATIKEEDLTLGRYKDESGKYIERMYDELGNSLESDEEYNERLEKQSKEFNEILRICDFVENNIKKYIIFKDVGGDFSDETLVHEIRKHEKLYGIKYYFYDTLKATTTDWMEIKTTATIIRETAKSLNGFSFADLQLTDDAIHVPPLELSSLNIASCKGLKHVCDYLFLIKEVPNHELYLYEYCSNDDKEWGEPVWKNLNPDYRYYIAKTDKNRKGSKVPVLFRIDLDYNTWIDLGIVRKKEFEKKKGK